MIIAEKTPSHQEPRQRIRPEGSAKVWVHGLWPPENRPPVPKEDTARIGGIFPLCSVITRWHVALGNMKFGSEYRAIEAASQEGSRSPPVMTAFRPALFRVAMKDPEAINSMSRDAVATGDRSRRRTHRTPVGMFGGETALGCRIRCLVGGGNGGEQWS